MERSVICTLRGGVAMQTTASSNCHNSSSYAIGLWKGTHPASSQCHNSSSYATGLWKDDHPASSHYRNWLRHWPIKRCSSGLQPLPQFVIPLVYEKVSSGLQPLPQFVIPLVYEKVLILPPTTTTIRYPIGLWKGTHPAFNHCHNSLSHWSCTSGGVYVPCIYSHASWELL